MAVQHNALRSRQRGLSFLGVIFIGVFLVAAFAIGGQSIPVLLEYQAIKKAATKAAREESTVAGIRASFDRAGAIDDISSISGKDLQSPSAMTRWWFPSNTSARLPCSGRPISFTGFRIPSNNWCPQIPLGSCSNGCSTIFPTGA